MKPTPTTDTQRLRELLAAATPGPWIKDKVTVAETTYWVVESTNLDDGPFSEVECVHEPDAELIAALRNEAPALLDEIDALLQELENFRAFAEQLGATKAVSERDKAIAERDKLREEVAELRADAKRIGDQFREIGVNPANHNTGEKAAENVVSLVCRIEAERDSLRRENEELKARLR